MLDTLYRRPLPVDLVAFSSPTGRALFREALAAGGMEGYFPLAEQFQTQADPAFCGLGTLVVALNALGIDPGRLWKGPWRWYSEELLDCCVSLDTVRERGITLDELACVARCNGADAELHRAATSGADQLRAAITSAAGGDGTIVIAAYERAALGQTGAGHFSPVGGMHGADDVALLMDVARFKYPPHWVPVPRLHDAMQPVDPLTGKSRGWIVLRRRSAVAVLWTFGPGGVAGLELVTRIRAALAAPGDPIAAIVEVIGASRVALEMRATAATEHVALAALLTAQLRATAAHAAVTAIATLPPAHADAAALVLLVLGDDELLPAELFAEVCHLRMQVDSLASDAAEACTTCP